jgi:pyruvate/2-oxoacid:ferredoxin oxidoreductase alpha subunit
VIVLDRANAPGSQAPLFTEIAATLYGSAAHIRSHVYGLGGRELHPEDIREIVAGHAERFVGLRGAECRV